MNVVMDIYQLLGIAGGLLTALATVMFATGKLLVGQFERRLDERFSSQDEARIAGQKHWDTKFAVLELAAVNEAKEWQRIEREILLMKADMPIQYVRRDDYIRNQTIIEAKIDGLAMRIENAILKGERHG
jgi:biopolymer transport protein ExbB/TolQ